MIRFSLIVVYIIWSVILTTGAARAHVPFLENTDFSESEPFLIDPPIQKSRAVYGCLESGNDIDVYSFEITEQSHLRTFSLVPVGPDYEDFLPSFAVVGPGLALPEEQLPFKVPEGYGGVIVTKIVHKTSPPHFLPDNLHFQSKRGFCWTSNIPVGTIF